MTATRVAVPMLDLQAQWATIREEVREAVLAVLDSQRFIGGPELEAFEREVAEYSGTTHAVGVSSGTDALLVAMWALGIGPGDEVITVPYTFFATVGTIDRLGAKCRFVDIDPVTYNMDVSQVAAAINERTKAIVPVHLFGQCADMTPLAELACEHELPIIEDAAQAIGARNDDGKRAGAMGLAGCFSFFPSKNLGGIGDGGMITTSDADLAHKMAIMRNHGMEPAYHHEINGGNFRLDAVQAAALRVKLRHLDAWSEARRRNAADYRRLFAEHDLLDLVTLPTERDGVEHIYNQFVIRVPAEKRDGLLEHLRSHDVGCAIYYPKSAHEQPCFADAGYARGDFPESERAAAETLAIPVYPELTDEQKVAVVEAVASGLRG